MTRTVSILDAAQDLLLPLRFAAWRSINPGINGGAVDPSKGNGVASF